MTDSPRPGSPSDPTPYHDPYQGYSDPAYASSAPYGPSYSPPSMPPNPVPTEPIPQYWTQTYPHSGPAPAFGEQPPEPPRGPRPWLWAAAGFALAVVLAMVVWLVFVNTNPSRQQTSIPAMPSSTTTRTPTPTTTRSPTPPLFPFPLPSLPIPTVPTPSAGTNPGETEPVTYEVTGQGRAINITYTDTGGVMQTEFNVPLPWHKDANLPKPAKSSAYITVVNAGRDVTCKISIDGVQVQESTGALLTVCRPSG
jgi:Mycobacterium membrane protein